MGPVSGAGHEALRTDVLTTSMSKLSALREFWDCLRQEKKYWIIPIVAVLLLFGLLLLFAQSSAVAPFIYTLF